MHDSNFFKALLSQLEKYKLSKRQKKKPKIFNPNPKSAAEAKKMDFYLEVRNQNQFGPSPAVQFSRIDDTIEKLYAREKKGG